MTNQQIIEDIAKTIYGEDAVAKMVASGEEIPLHTLKGWQSRGAYRIKKGEHGIETRLWKKRTNIAAESNDPDSEKRNPDFYKAKAYLFSIEQVEKLDQ